MVTFLCAGTRLSNKHGRMWGGDVTEGFSAYKSFLDKMEMDLVGWVRAYTIGAVRDSR